MVIGGGRISPPGRWGGSRPPQWSDLSFFFLIFFLFAGGGQQMAMGGGIRWVIYLVA
jgi:hypothetical protein